MELNQDTITFGKYKGESLYKVLKDRSYCAWLLEQEWFENNYEYLYNRVKEFKPRDYFINNIASSSSSSNSDDNFLLSYEFFNLKDVNDIELELTQGECMCYTHYKDSIDSLRQQIYDRLEDEMENPYDIVAPKKWLQMFELKYQIPRKEFKEFISQYDLPNIPYIVERIKKEGGIEYKGAKSFLIAKARSEDQEAWWEAILKERYGEDIGAQFKYENCVFDFINIKTNTIFECKLSLKDFNKEQHRKYKLTLNTYRIIYLISKDAVIDIERKNIYTLNGSKYESYKLNIPNIKSPSYLDELIQNYEVIEVECIKSLFN